MIPRVVITGAPASGKTEFIHWIRDSGRFQDFVFFDELARALLLEDPAYRQKWHEFHREIYSRQIQREDLCTGRPFISDRGTVDAFAFHPETMAAVGTTLEREYQRYTLVVHLGTTAGLESHLYCNDSVRHETAAEAMEIEHALNRAWSGHSAYHFVPPRRLLKEKFDLAVQIISNEIEEIANN
jgi:predicted ATPase